MSIDLHLAIAGALVGFLVGLTGMGGGALLTPLLVLFFGVQPLAAVSSDLVTSLIMKPFGAAVHFRRRTVNLALLGWLTLGSVPAAFLSSVLIGLLLHGGSATSLQGWLKVVIAVALLASVAGTIHRLVVERRNPNPLRDPGDVVVRPLRTLLIGAVGGAAVGLTSVGAGSLIIALLLVAYPMLRANKLVGTDIAQAIPLVAAASLGHLIFGDVQFGLTASLLVGAIPAVVVGALVSSRAPAGLIQPIMAGVLTASALALLKVPTTGMVVGALLAGICIAALSRARDAAAVSAVPAHVEGAPHP